MSELARRLPTTLQLQHAERLCERLNRPIDCERVDFRALVSDRETYSENLESIANAHPELQWEERTMGPKSLEEAQVWEASDMVDEFSYGVVKKSKIKKLERDSRRAGRLKKKLVECEEIPRRYPSKPGTCRIKTVKVGSYSRCPPRK